MVMERDVCDMCKGRKVREGGRRKVSKGERIWQGDA